MTATIIPFPSHRCKNRSGKARGKQLTSRSNNPKQGSTTSTDPPCSSGSMPQQAPATFHMEVTIKLTLELSL